jgi:hypothetical protein
MRSAALSRRRARFCVRGFCRTTGGTTNSGLLFALLIRAASGTWLQL